MALFRRSKAPETPGGAAAAPVPTSDVAPERIPLSRAEQARLDRLREGLAAFGADTSTPTAVGRLLARTGEEWLAIPQKRRPASEPSINIFGVGLGDHLCRMFGGHWVTYVDANGSEPAVQIGDAGPLIFPISTVATWWGKGDAWVAQYLEEVRQEVAEAAAAPAPPPPAPAAPPADAAPAAGAVPPPSSAQVNSLAKRALDAGVDAVVPGPGPLVPFALVEDPYGRVETVRFAGDAAQSLEQARRHVRSQAPIRAAVAWEGVVDVGGRRSRAILVEASDRGAASVVVAQRHEDGAVLGTPVLVGRQAPLC